MYVCYRIQVVASLPKLRFVKFVKEDSGAIVLTSRESVKCSKIFYEEDMILIVINWKG